MLDGLDCIHMSNHYEFGFLTLKLLLTSLEGIKRHVFIKFRRS